MRLIFRLLVNVHRKCLSCFLVNLIFRSLRTLRRFRQGRLQGENFPAFHFISVTNNCNLSCQGCWVTKGQNAKDIDLTVVNNIIKHGKNNDSFFYGILGGEPFLFQPLLNIFRQNTDCYFQLFTNGLLLNDQIAADLQRCGNVSPLISFEGDQDVADIRRGGVDVYGKALDAIDASVRHKLITGVAISVCKSNIHMAMDPVFLKMLWNRGVVYIWYYIFRPSGSNPSYQLALSVDEINQLRRFMVYARTRFPIVIVDAYWDAEGNPLCPAAEGLSHHINPYGDIELCPVLQFASHRIDENADVKNIYENSKFIKNFKKQVYNQTRGCILMEDPKWLTNFILCQDVYNTSNRDSYLEKLTSARPICSHGKCDIIPERSWAYRIAKRNAFFGLGAYG